MSDESSNESGESSNESSSASSGHGDSDSDIDGVDPVIVDCFPETHASNCVLDFQGMVFNALGFAHACNSESGLVSECVLIMGFFCKMVDLGCCQDVAAL